ncbi:MAG: hypothetical protein GY917_26435 [Planctomycetaceae bacterium]|jgi:hypothetical protein|nr:hypothetical protein [Planctomycetaceae bacterium]
MKNITCKEILASLLLATLVGCGNGTSSSPTIDGSKYQLSSEPTGAIQVLELRSKAANDDAVVVVGRIGGAQPWVEGLSAFTLVDSSLPACNEIEGDDCRTPWDYCCEPNLGTKQTLIKVVNQEGQPLEVGAQELLKLKELQTVVVQGKVKLDSSGNMSILASGIYIRP